jgi:hypothetical protein
MTNVAPITVITDTPDGMLDYLVQRTAETIGKLVDRAGAVVVGEVEETRGHSVPVRDEDAGRLQAWFSREVCSPPRIVLHQTRVRVQEWLTGPDTAGTIDLVYVPRTDSRTSETFPLFEAHDAGLLFLQSIPPDLPYAAYIPARSRQLAPGEKGMRRFHITDYDDRGRPYIRNETDAVQETIAAVRWYVALPINDPVGLNAALFHALSEAKPHIVEEAIRQLANRRIPSAADRLREMLGWATGELRVRLMLGLWILDERDLARDLLEKILREDGRAAVLGRWGLQATSTETGRPAGTLFGPDPAEVKGD